MFEKIIIVSEVFRDETQIMGSFGELKKFGTRHCMLIQCLEKHEVYSQIQSYLKNIYKIMLDSQKNILKEIGFNVETNVVSGDLKNPFVVMGSQGRGFVTDLFLGSVSHNIARQSSSSVLLIPYQR